MAELKKSPENSLFDKNTPIGFKDKSTPIGFTENPMEINAVEDPEVPGSDESSPEQAAE
ncbi:hypothetical protein [Mucilaginibacter sp.]|uniref:hypothetical protein n=1 Tax=Mucilaginibacter sp. TaxID=1882438 RepID=UPI002615B9B7|nr:hypothetical protein [Mucilaginibacter sp.]MDB4921624.1 hypothetical protein [Mucilaginibacter sp.]